MTSTDEPIKISWSMLRNHETCKQKSYLLRSGKRASTQNLRGYYHGMVVDSAMRQWLNNPDRSAGEMEARIDALIDEGIQEAIDKGDGVVRWKTPTDRDEVRVFCVDLVRRLEPILYELILPHTFNNGYRFKANLQAGDVAIILTGEMDLRVRNDGWEVWDLKGTRDNSYFRKVLGQLVFYDIANWCETGQKTTRTGLIQPMCDEPVMPFIVSDDDRRNMVGRILRMADDIRRQNNACKDDTAGCSWCEVNHACARYQPATPTGNTMSLGGALRAAAQHDTQHDTRKDLA